MRVLLDTHALLWIVADSPLLSSAARQMAGDPTIEKVLSIASLWEIAIKVQLGKLDLGMEFDDMIGLIQSRALAEFLTITPGHLMRLRRLDFHHRDPFDRMLVAQALTENLPLVSADGALDAYGVQRLW